MRCGELGPGELRSDLGPLPCVRTTRWPARSSRTTAAAVSTAFSNCSCAVPFWPALIRALPPTATRTRLDILLSPHESLHDGLLNVKPVFCFLEDTELDESMISVCHSSFRCAGRQCMKRAPGSAMEKSSRFTWYGAKIFRRASASCSCPMLAQVSVYTTSASRTASAGSDVQAIAAPVSSAAAHDRSITPASGLNVAGSPAPSLRLAWRR